MSTKTETLNSTASTDITERKRAEEALERSEEQLRSVVQTAKDAISITDSRGNITFWNSAAEAMFGYTSDEIIGKPVSILMPERFRTIFGDAFKKTVSSGEIQSYEAIAERFGRRKDGSEFPVEISDTQWEIKEGVFFTSIMRDITEHKRMEQRIEHLNRVLQAIRNVNQLIAREKDRDRLIKGICNNLVETRGYYNAWLVILDESGSLVTTAEAGLSKDFLPLVEQLKRGELPDCTRRVLRQSEVMVTEVPLSTCVDCPLAGVHHGRGIMTVRLEHGGKVYGVVAVSIPKTLAADEEEQSLVKEIASDIAYALHNIELEEERKQAEEALRESEDKYRRLFELSPIGITTVDMKGVITSCNPAVYKEGGYTEGELVGKHFSKIASVRIRDAPNLARVFSSIIRGKVPEPFEVAYKRKDETVGWTELHIALLKADGKKLGVQVLQRDITKRKQAEEALEFRKKELEDIMQNVVDGIGVSDVQGKIIQANKALAEMHGYDSPDEVIGRPFFDFVAKEDLSRISEMFQEMMVKKEKTIKNIEMIGLKKDSSKFSEMINITNSWDKDGSLIRSFVVAHDITERKQAGAKLRESEEKYRVLTESSIDSISLYDCDGRCLYLNQVSAKFLGKKRADVLGRLLTDIFPEEMAGEILNGIRSVFRRNDIVRREYMFRVNGESRYSLTTLAPVRNIDGHVVTVMRVATDITERKRMEEKIKQAAKEWRTTFDSITDGISICDKDFKLVRLNKAFAGVFKKKPQELIGKPCYEIFHGTNEPVPNCPHKKTIKTKKPATAEFFEPHLGVHLEISTSPIFNDEGEVVACVHVARDITERKRAEEKIREAEERYRSLVNNVKLGIFRSTLETPGRFLEVNPAMEEITGYSREELLQMKVIDLYMHAEERAVFIEKVTSTARRVTREPRFRRKDGTEIVVWATTVAVRDAAGKILYIDGIMEDITEHKRAEQELQEKTRQLEVASQAKSKFLASMSHELRTPLNAVIGFSELMLDGVPGEINEEQEDCLNDILSSGQQLLNLINDVLDLSKIEAGRIELKLENLNLADVINKVVSTVKPMLDENRHKIGVSVGEGLPPVHADKRRLRQILLNLLSNAIKFTPPGGKLGIKVTRNGDWCQVSVVDNGTGIKEEDQERVFEVFTQAATLPKEKEGGTGLGLALTKQFVEAIGGRIWVESEYGKGSKFIFTLPLAREGELYPEREGSKSGRLG